MWQYVETTVFLTVQWSEVCNVTQSKQYFNVTKILNAFPQESLDNKFQ